jgi:hypothetical protein
MSVLWSRRWLPLWLLVCASPVGAQDGDRIWGAVFTTSGERYEGFIRWDRNEGGWADILHGSKEIPKESYEAWLDARTGGERPTRTIDLKGYRISWDEEDPDFPSIAPSGIRFGHLAALTVVDRDRVALTLRSGGWLELSGGSTDIGTSIRELTVDDPQQGSIELEWRELERIVFSSAPSGTRAEARRLYGTVEDRLGRRFSGYVSWDLDEILETDVLDGEDEDGKDREIEFGDIRAIERTESGARVTLASGDRLHLSGTNDVDRGHRGVQISDPDLGMVEVEWDDFVGLRFQDLPPGTGYDAFDGGHRLRGTVVTESGEEIRGQVRWSTDQHWSWELLTERSDGVSLTIELGRIASIRRNDPAGTAVTLVDGRTFLLDEPEDADRDDVDPHERGIFIEPLPHDESAGITEVPWRYVPWDEFREVRLERSAESHHGAGGGDLGGRGRRP